MSASSLRRVLVPFLAAAPLLAAPSSASAETSLYLRAGIASDDLFRGISFFDGAPAELGLELENDGGLFAGAVLSAVVEETSDRELDLYVGWYRQQSANRAWSVTLYRYTFSGEASEFDFTELDLVWEQAYWSAELAFSPDVYGTDTSSVYGAISGWIELRDNLVLRPYAGLYTFSDSDEVFYLGAPDGYAHYGLELRAWIRDLELSVGWSGTDADADLLFGERSAENRFVASIGLRSAIKGRAAGRSGRERNRL